MFAALWANIVCVATAHLYCYITGEAVGNMWTNRKDCIPVRLCLSRETRFSLLTSALKENSGDKSLYFQFLVIKHKLVI